MLQGLTRGPEEAGFLEVVTHQGERHLAGEEAGT